MKAFVTRTLPSESIERLKAQCETEVWEDGLPPPREVLLEKIKDVDALLCLLTDKIDSELIASSKNLKVISNMAVGFDNIDLDAATKHGIPVSYTPGVLTETTADFAFALMMAVSRRVVEADKFVRVGKWETWGPMLLLGQDLHGSALGIIGLGRIGAAVARRATGFQMKVCYYDLVRQLDLERGLGLEYVPFERLLATSDFISIHTNLSKETFHLISTKEFEQMKSNCVLVNTSRGPIVDNMALYDALKENKIFGAGLDVTEPEPLPADHPLLKLENVIIAPHIASASISTRTQMADTAVDAILAVLSGKPPQHLVNPSVLKKED